VSDDLERLKALAKQAQASWEPVLETDGPYRWYTQLDGLDEVDEAFICEASPDVISGLIGELVAARTVIDAAKEIASLTMFDWDHSSGERRDLIEALAVWDETSTNE
jgi:hypothetical protein